MCPIRKLLIPAALLPLLIPSLIASGRFDTGSFQAQAQLLSGRALAPAYFEREDIYPDVAQAPNDLAHALRQAPREKKRILLDFGGNWCPDCHVLDIYFHQPENLKLLQANFIVVHINVGHLDENEDIAAKYGIPLKKGVPALAVLDSHGKLLYGQQHGEFESMGRMDPASVNQFLNQWKP